MIVSAEYRALLDKLQSLGYCFRDFDHSHSHNAVILRHDIDFCLRSALKLAEFESDMGISATYFFMISTNTYTLPSAQSQSIIRDIQSLEHTVSLHFDASIYVDVDKGFGAERTFFENMFDVPVEISSLHRPGPFLENNNRRLPNCQHTYEDRYFRHMKYVSDSGGSFSHGHPVDAPEVSRGANLHLLIHPIWWTTSGGSPSDKLREWQRRYYSFLNEETIRNCKSFDGLAAK